MKKILIISTLLMCLVASGQESNTENELVGGKWSTCTDYTFSKDYQCTKGYTSYEFFNNGKYKEDRQPVYMGKQMPFVSGIWTLQGNKLMIDEDDDQYHKSFPHNYKIIWLDKNRFYAKGREGHKTIYIFFQRS